MKDDDDESTYVWVDNTTGLLWTFQVNPKIMIQFTEGCFGVKEDYKIKKLLELTSWISNSELLGEL